MKRPYKIGIIVGLIIVVLLGLFFGRDWEEKRNVAQYLRERYGQEFIIKKVESHWRYLGSEKEIWTHVVSKDNPPIEFIVSRLDKQPGVYWETSIRNGHEGYVNYLEYRWERETSPKLQEVAEGIFKRPVIFYAFINEPKSYREKKFGTLPSFFATLKNTPEVFQEKYGGKYFDCVFFYDINDTNINQECANIYIFMQQLKIMGIGRYDLIIHYFAPAYQSETQQIIDRIGLRTFIINENGSLNIPDNKKVGQLKITFYVRNEDISKIKSPSDLLKYFRNIPK